MVASSRSRHTRADYIALERMANVKHEFLDGVIYAMGGGSPEHARIALNVGSILNQALRGRGESFVLTCESACSIPASTPIPMRP